MLKRDSLGAAAIALVTGWSCGAARAQPSYNFTPVTQLAQGALVGQNVDTPVPGFDLLFLKDGVLVYHQSFGAWSLDRVANCDSATKTLSGALILSLSDSSPLPLSLDTRLSEYIPAFFGDKAAITIRQAFSHTSGLADSAQIGSQTLTLQQLAVRIAIPALEYSPGTAFKYGGTSMQAAGAVAELAGGQAWDTMFAQRISGPLGMTHTSYVLSTPTNPRIAGGCESNATEFGRFMETLRRGGVSPSGTRVLSQGAVAQMFTRQTANPITILGTPSQSPYTDGADYGVGVWLDERDAQGHLLGAMAAGARGFSSWIDFDDGMVGVFATDQSAAGNVQHLLYLLRSAAQDVIRAPICSATDFPSVVAQPGNQTSCPGGTSTFALAASGFGTLAYRWQIQDEGVTADLADGDGVALGAGYVGNVRGSGTAQVEITSVRKVSPHPNVIQILGRVSNACGSATSDAATLTVCVADFNCSGAASVQDIFDYLAAWFALDPKADVNGGGLGVQDVFDFLAAWFAGC